MAAPRQREQRNFFKTFTALEVLDEVLNDSDSGEENLYSGDEDESVEEDKKYRTSPVSDAGHATKHC